MNQTIPNVTQHLVCTKCGHEQDATSAVAEVDDAGDKHFWFGSSHDFCDKCDGPVVVKE